MKKKYWPLGLLLVVFFTSAWADVNLTPTVVTATTTERILEEAPGSIEVVTALEIEETGAATVAEALEYATGLVVTSDTGRAQTANIRGTGNKRSLVLIDGRRLAAGYKDFTDMAQLPVSMIERIEIVRGPNSAIYGSDAIGGVVNIITRKMPEKTVAEVFTRIGSHTDGKGVSTLASALAGFKAGRASFLLSAGVQDQEGWDKDHLSPDDGDEETLSSAAGRVAFDINDTAVLSAGLELFDLDHGGIRFFENKDRIRQAEDHRLNYYLQYDAGYNAGQNLLVRAYRSEHENRIGFDPPASVTGEEDARRWLNQVEARYATPLFERHILTIGGEFRNEGRKDSAGANDDLDNIGLFIQDEFQITGPLYLAGGLRYDDHSEFGGELTPRVSLIYGIQRPFRIKASIAQGFRAPSISELYVTSYRQKGKIIYEPNPDLQPEESLSYEIGIEGERGVFSGEITAFRNDIDNLIEAGFIRSQVSGKNKKTFYQYQNIAEARTQGIEIETRIGLPHNLTLDGTLTWMDTENRTTGEELEGHPEFKGRLKLAWRHPELKLKTLLSLNYFGERHYLAGDEDGYTTLNCYISKECTGMITLFAGIDNILDEEKSSDGVTYIEPARIYAGLTIKY